jgi:hypothetical protein
LLQSTLPSSDSGRQLVDSWVVWQSRPCNGRFGKSPIVVTITLVGNPRRSEMRFATLTPEMQSLGQRFFGKRYAGTTTINPVEIYQPMRLRQLTMCNQKHWIVCHGLIQESHGVTEIFGYARVESKHLNEALRT